MFKYWKGIAPFYLNDIFMPSLNNSNTRLQMALDMPQWPAYLFTPPPSSLKMEEKVSYPLLFVPSREMRKNFFSSFHPSPHLDFEINSPLGASRTISTLKMSQTVEILISHLVLIVN